MDTMAFRSALNRTWRTLRRSQAFRAKRRIGTLAVGPDGARMPAVGCGTAVFTDLGPNQKNLSSEYADSIVSSALDAGYRLIDCASMYENEGEIGTALKSAFASGRVSRDDVFVVTKVGHPNISTHTRCDYIEDPAVDAYRGATEDIDRSLRLLQLDRIDAALVHWPGPFGNQDAALGRNKRAEIWGAFEDAYDAGKVRCIGVSNFEPSHMSQLEQSWRVRPMLNQIECHPYLAREDLIGQLQAAGTQVMAYCPLGSGLYGLMTDPVLVEIAEKYQKSTGQVVLRWHVQRGVVPVPKSTKRERIASNLDIEGFELTQDEVARITKLDRNAHVCPDPAEIA